MEEQRFTEVWGQSHTTLSAFGYRSARRTYRFIVHSAISGEKIRVCLSNVYGKQNVAISNVTISLCDSEGMIANPDNIIDCTFGTQKRFTLASGEKLLSEPVDFVVNVGEYIAISVFVTGGRLSSGNLMSDIGLKIASGDNSHESSVKDKRLFIDRLLPHAEKALKLPLYRPIPLLESVELLNSDGAKEIVAFGDSITQQGYWANAFAERLRLELPSRYSFVNRSLMGNRVLRDCSDKFILKGWYGRRATQRMQDELLTKDNVTHCLLFIGINDIIQYGTADAYANEKPDVEELVKTLEDMSSLLRRQGIKVMLFTIMPFGGAGVATSEKREMRVKTNQLLRETRASFDAVFELDDVIAEAGNREYTDPACLGPDGLHINALGGERIARAIDINFFK